MQVCVKLFSDSCPLTTIKVSGLDFRSSIRFKVWAKSRSINWVLAPQSIIAEALIGFWLGTDRPSIWTGMTIGSSEPKSLDSTVIFPTFGLTDIPVLPNPLIPRSVSGISFGDKWGLDTFKN